MNKMNKGKGGRGEGGKRGRGEKGKRGGGEGGKRERGRKIESLKKSLKT